VTRAARYRRMFFVLAWVWMLNSIALIITMFAIIIQHHQAWAWLISIPAVLLVYMSLCYFTMGRWASEAEDSDA
jgi:carbon starvation protein CstA